MGMTERQWAQLVLEDAGLPVTQNNISNVLQWMTAEEPTSNWFDRNNPLNTGLDSGPADGTGSYQNLTVGAHYTAATIDLPVESGIRNALAHNVDRAQFDRALQEAPWAQSHYPYIDGVKAPNGSTPAPADQVGSGRVDPVSGVKPTKPTHGTDAKTGTHHKKTTGTHTKGKKVEVVKTEMADLSKLLQQGEADVAKVTPLTNEAIAALKDISSLQAPGTGTDPTVITDLTRTASSLSTVVTELQGLLTKISTGLKADDELVSTTTKKTTSADSGSLPGAISSLLGPGLSTALGHSGSTGTKKGTKKGAKPGTDKHGTKHGTSDPTGPTSAKVTAEDKKLVSTAHSFLGIPYVYGGDSRAGLDCSGLTQQIYAKALHKNIGRDTTAQLASGKTVGTDGDWAKDVKLLKPGDLIFYGEPGASGPNAHVVIYIGDGKVIQAAEPGTKVMVSNLFESASPDEPFLGVRRYT